MLRALGRVLLSVCGELLGSEQGLRDRSLRSVLPAVPCYFGLG